MGKSVKILLTFFFMLGLSILAVGCIPVENKIEEYSSNKEQCSLNSKNVTQFNYKSQKYTILNETVSNECLGDWVGYFRKFAVVDEQGKVLTQENIEKATSHSLADLKKRTPKAAYIIPLLNVYTASDDTSYLIVDVNGGYHKAVLSSKSLIEDKVFDFKKESKSTSGKFLINPHNATQLLYKNMVYQVTSEVIQKDELGKFLDILAERVFFDPETNKILTKKELNKIDWLGASKNQKREDWFYVDIYEVQGVDMNEAVGVKVNNDYYIAKKQ